MHHQPNEESRALARSVAVALKADASFRARFPDETDAEAVAIALSITLMMVDDVLQSNLARANRGRDRLDGPEFAALLNHAQEIASNG